MFLCLDFETNGLLKNVDMPSLQPGITEIGAIKLDPLYWDECSEFSMVVNPEQELDEEALKISKIPREEILAAPTLPEVFFDFASFCVGCTHLFAFNGMFDLEVLDWQMKRYSLQYRFPHPPIYTDIMKISKDFANIQGKQDIKYPKLTELYQILFGKEYSSAHRALSDARATGECARELHKKGILL